VGVCIYVGACVRFYLYLYIGELSRLIYFRKICFTNNIQNVCCGVAIRAVNNTLMYIDGCIASYRNRN